MSEKITEILAYTYTHSLVDKNGLHYKHLTDLAGNQLFSSKEALRRKKIYEYRKQHRQVTGVLFGSLDELSGLFIVSYSLCAITKDNYDKSLAVDIASDRHDKLAVKYDECKDNNDSLNEFIQEYINSIPNSIYSDFVKFTERCHKYFKGIDAMFPVSNESHH